MIVAPSIGDTHPDHSASNVALQLAMTSLPELSATCLEYLVHQAEGYHPGETIHVTLEPADIARKRNAILRHESQMTLSQRRFLRYARPTEAFSPLCLPATMEKKAPGPALHWEGGLLRLHFRRPFPGIRLGRGKRILLAGKDRQGTPFGWSIPIKEGSAEIEIRNEQGKRSPGKALLSHRGPDIKVSIPAASLHSCSLAFVKMETSRLFFDEAGWECILNRESPARQPDRQPEPHVACYSGGIS